MKLIKPSVEIFPQDKGLEGIYKQIEKAARVCYKSEDKITDNSAKKMVEALIKNKHFAMLEHGTVYLKIKWWHIFKFFKYLLNPYSKIRKFKYITTNLRAIKEHNWDNDLKYICEPTEYHEKRITVKFITSIGIGREILRHRKASFANESTRYCNYSSDKFGNEITFIEPSWYNNIILDSDEILLKIIFNALLEESESNYFLALKNRLKPEEARELLPLCTKSELVMTAFESDWEHFFDLRYFGKTGRPHPDIKKLAEDLYNKFKEMRN